MEDLEQLEPTVKFCGERIKVKTELRKNAVSAANTAFRLLNFVNEVQTDNTFLLNDTARQLNARRNELIKRCAVGMNDIINWEDVAEATARVNNLIFTVVHLIKIQ